MEEDSDSFDEKIRDFFEEDALRAKINRTFLGLEIKITIDHLMDYGGARLISQQGRGIDVHPETLKCYYELLSLIYDYTKMYGKKPELEAMRDKWATPARRVYFESN